VWRAAWELFCDRPVCGWGLDAFRLAFGARRPADYEPAEWNSTPTRAHNELLHVLATQGLLGGAAVLVLLAGLARAARRAWRAAAPEDRPFLAALLASLAGFAVQDLFGFTVAGCGTLFCTGAALLSRWGSPRDPSETTGAAAAGARWTWAGGLPAGGAVALLVFALNAGVGAWPVCLALGAAGAVVTLAVLRLEAGPPRLRIPGRRLRISGQSAREPPPARLGLKGRLLLHLGIGAASAAALGAWVVRPYRAGLACHAGDLLVQDDPRAALASYERAVALDPGSAHCWTRLSGAAQLAARRAPTAAEQQGDLRRARAALDRAVALVPADPFHHANRGRLLGELACRGLTPPAEALAEWEAALAGDPCNALFLAEAARTALALGDYARARRYATRGLALYPRFPLLRAQLGACAFAEGRLAEAAAVLGAASDADWGADGEGLARALATRAAVHLGLRQFDRARQDALAALVHQPLWPPGHFLLAQALQGLGQRQAACAAYRCVLTLSPGDARALRALRQLRAPAPGTPSPR
jgi:tetratricopeptide (TPR) repeat protein